MPIAAVRDRCPVRTDLPLRLSHARYACNAVTILYRTMPCYAAAVAVQEECRPIKVLGARAQIAVVSDINGKCWE